MERIKVQSLVALVALVVLTGCSSGNAAPIVMPNVVGRQLDVALKEVESAGIDDEVNIEGGGTFGIINKSNWTVCEQDPAAGKEVSSPPRVSVKRSCTDEDAATTSSTTLPPTTTATTAAPVIPANLTAANNPDLAAVLFAKDCSPKIAEFANKYPLATIEFNGSINAMNPSGGGQYRFDIGVSPGDKGGSSSVGPSFQFKDVVTVGLLTGPNIPESIGVGTKLYVVAQLQSYDPGNCLFEIKPVAVTAR